MKKYLFSYLLLAPLLFVAACTLANSKTLAKVNFLFSTAPSSPVSPPTLPSVIPSPIEKNSSQTSGTNSLNVPFKTCGELKNWQRPTLPEQTANIKSSPRYQQIDSVTLKSQLSTLQNQQIFVLTNYGLSALTDRLSLIGINSISEEVYQSCYPFLQIQKLNQGAIAELWLINHQVQKITWHNNSYLITVKPTKTGIKFVQFERQERLAKLPLQIVDPQGKALIEQENPAFASVWQSPRPSVQNDSE